MFRSLVKVSTIIPVDWPNSMNIQNECKIILTLSLQEREFSIGQLRNHHWSAIKTNKQMLLEYYGFRRLHDFGWKWAIWSMHKNVNGNLETGSYLLDVLCNGKCIIIFSMGICMRFHSFFFLFAHTDNAHSTGCTSISKLSAALA